MTRILRRLQELNKSHSPSAWLPELIRMFVSVTKKKWNKFKFINLYRVGVHAHSVFGSSIFLMYPDKITSSGPVIFGDRVSMTSEFSEGFLTIRDDVEIGCDTELDFSGGLVIGSKVHISSDVVIYTHSHGKDPRSKPIQRFLKIGDNTWIGSRATIMDSVGEIGQNVIIGSASVVTKSIPGGEVWAGNPAKKIGVR